MGKISRIQLRGISRTPSDRLTEDGGCAESLNVSLDHSELAPSFIPEDVTRSLGLPDDLQAEKVFVHKTANYENYIIVTGNQVGVLKEGELDYFLTAAYDENIVSVMSFGNTLGVSTTNYTYWILYKEGKYTMLGAKVPFPKFKLANYEVAGRDLADDESEIEVVRNFAVSRGATNRPVEKLSYSKLNESYSENRDVTDEDSLALISEVWSKFAEAEAINRKSGVFNHQVHAIFSVRLLDGSEYISTPILLGAGFNAPIKVDYSYVIDDFFESGGDGENAFSNHEINYWTSLRCQIKTAFKIFLQIEEDEDFFDDWKDVVDSVNVYVSSRIATNLPKARAKVENPHIVTETDSNMNEETGKGYRREVTTSTAEIILGSQNYDYEQQHLNASVFRLFKTYPIKELKSLISGEIVSVNPDTMSDDAIERVLDFSKASMSHYYTNFSGSAVYNSRVIAFGIEESLEMKVSNLNAVNYSNKSLQDDFTPPGSEEFPSTHLQAYFSLTYHLRDTNGKEKKITATHPVLLPKGISYVCYGDGIALNDIETFANVYSFLICPDRRAYKVDVEFRYYSEDRDEVIPAGVGHFDLKEHPYLNCSYYFGGVDKNLIDKCNDYDNEYQPGPTSLKEEQPNKIYMSDVDSPFMFPIASRYTLQSKVLGVAIASTALSQGQFGQFPLYVFTEDGIWAMETAADGSFVTSKPLSRDVCVNPDSITSIDNAVVFVTDKGVMLLQGSQVVNISPNMNGRHYVMEETAKSIIEGQELFKDFIPVLTDGTHFMAFIKEATIAYDYPGQRLIFIKKDEKYQYVYKLDTQTWHKTAYGIDLIAPVNSYPECLVQGQTKTTRTIVKWYVTEYAPQEEMSYLAEQIKIMLPDATDREIIAFFDQEGYLDVSHLDENQFDWLIDRMDSFHVATSYSEVTTTANHTRIYDLSTVLDAADSRKPTRGVIVTRPFDLGAPDVLKTITDIRIRGPYGKGGVRFLLLGSMDGVNFYVIGTKRGKAWKLFRLIILANIEPTERVSWVDVIFEEKFTNRLR